GLERSDYNEWKVIRGVDSETVKGRSSGRGKREAIFVGSGKFHLWSKATQRPRTDTLRLFNNQHLEMGSNVELIWPESEAYSSRVNNCSHANSSLAAIRAKLSAEQLEQFKTSCFGHLLNIDKIQFSGQIVHGVVLRRVAGQGVKDLDGLSFLIGALFWEVPEVSSGESDEIRLQKRYFIDEGITCNALEEAFLRCTEEDDIYKLALVYFAELVVLGRDKHLNINLNYLTLVEDLDAFNRGKRKGKSMVTGTSRRNEKGKKDKHGEAQRGGWSFKGFTYAFQIWVYELIPRMADLNYCKVVDPTAVRSVQLRALCPSEEEMRQPYWSWPQDRPAVVSQSPQFEQEVRRDLALLKERMNRCVISHLFKGSEEMDDIQWDEGPSNRNEGEEKEDEGIEGGEGPSNRNEGEEKEEEGIEGGEVQGKPSEVEEAQRKRKK
ncbi:BURP domain-containing protein, partial [Prunus dulcis]